MSSTLTLISTYDGTDTNENANQQKLIGTEFENVNETSYLHTVNLVSFVNLSFFLIFVARSLSSGWRP